MNECKLCMEGIAGFFDWNCCGCRARWLATIPTEEWRQQAIQQWRQDGETGMVEAVEQRLAEMG